MVLDDTVDAFIDVFSVAGAEDGPLAGLTFGAKDLYDVAGYVTGCGSPDWAKTHKMATQTAPAVQALLDAGARLVGKTHTDEIAYSLMGVNAHYGTPINSAAPDRVPGGSSSGSVAAVAAGLVDIGLGSDTGGSVRMPASFCGVYGIRTTHGRIDLSKVMALAPSFDTCGWFARDAATFAKAGLAYGIDAKKSGKVGRLLVAQDAFGIVGQDVRDALDVLLNDLKDRASTVEIIDLAATDFFSLRKVFMVCQAAEVWQVHGEWVMNTDPNFGPGVRGRFEMASKITADELTAAQKERVEITKRLDDMLGDDAMIVLPTGPGPAPLRDAEEVALNDFRMAALDLLCSAGLAGLPQINIPAGMVDNAPVGLSLVGVRGKDEMVLEAANG